MQTIGRQNKKQTYMTQDTIETPRHDCEAGKPSLVGLQTPPDDKPWFALRLFCNRQKELAALLKDKGLEVFIPMAYVDVVRGERRVRQELRPVVRNLLFVKKTVSTHAVRLIVAESPYRAGIIKGSPERSDYYEIPSRQMFEFMAMCNPEIYAKQFLSEAQAKLKAGTPVVVTHGPLKGLQGRLVRANKQYYLLKEVPGIGVMLKVTKWCCKPMV